MNLRLDDTARDELIEATAWYVGRDPAAARRFVQAVDAALERIAESPDARVAQLEASRATLRGNGTYGN